jgi:putative GTP pyrophosphokinase
MQPVPPDELKLLHDRYSREEYQRQLDQIVADVRAVVHALPVKYQLKYRVKSFEEYQRKWKSLGGTPIGDMLGIRITCPFLDDVRVVERALAANLCIAEVDRKGERHSFREFGYESTHLVLDLNRETIPHPLPGVAPVCEIQIRTILQDAWAEVEHALIYKSDWSIPTDQIRRKLAALNANLSLSDLIFQELKDLQKEVQRKQERRRELQAARSHVVSSVESHALDKRLDAESLDEAQRLDLDKLVLHALTAHSEGSYAAAIQLYSLVLTREGVESIRPVILNHRGMAYFALGENHAARADFETAVATDGTSHRAWYNLGLAHRTLGEPGLARDAFARSSALDPSFLDARVQHLRALLDERDVATARQVLRGLAPGQADRPEIADLREALAALVCECE